MKMYFDESGDTGSLTNKSNTTHFSICIYVEDKGEDTQDFLINFRNQYKIKRTEIKWYKLDKETRKQFINTKYKIESNILCSVCNKNNTKSHGENLFESMLTELLTQSNLSGKIYYDGDHLTKVMHRISKNLRARNVKINFVNKNSANEIGIQIADLYAGAARDNQHINKVKIIKYK